MEDKLHVAVSVKDFRAVVLHADTLGVSVSAQYSHPSRPMQLSYDRDGIVCQFTLMTTGYFRGGTATPAPLIAPRASTTSSRQEYRPTGTAETPASPARSLPARPRMGAETSAPTLTGHSKPRPSQPRPKTSLEYDSLFFPEQAEDQRWNDEGPRHEDDGVLGWDASGNNVRTCIVGAHRKGVSDGEFAGRNVNEFPSPRPAADFSFQSYSRVRG